MRGQACSRFETSLASVVRRSCVRRPARIGPGRRPHHADRFPHHAHASRRAQRRGTEDATSDHFIDRPLRGTNRDFLSDPLAGVGRGILHHWHDADGRRRPAHHVMQPGIPMVVRDDIELNQAMLAEAQRSPDPRFRQLLSAAVKHLHAFVRKTDLTEAESLAAGR